LCGANATHRTEQTSILLTNRPGIRFTEALGEAIVQSTQPRDVAALVFVIGLFAVLLVVSLTVGSPAR
jgi:hypothetical protein